MKRKLAMVLAVLTVLSVAFVPGAGATEETDYAWEWVPVEGTQTIFSRPFGSMANVEAEGIYYMFGGAIGPNAPYTYYKNFYSYNSSTKEWSTLPSHPIGGGGVGTTYHNGKIYTVGGHIAPSTYTKKAYAYDIAAGVWEPLPDYPFNTKCAGIFVYNDTLYVFGGQTAPSGAISKKLYALDLNNTAAGWQMKADLLRGAWMISMPSEFIAVDGFIYCFDYNASAPAYYQKYDIENDVWSAIAGPGSSILHTSMSFEGNCFYLTTKTTMYVYDIADDSWSTSLIDASKVTNTAMAGGTYSLDSVYIFGSKNYYTAMDRVVYKLERVTKLYVLLGIAEEAQLSMTHNLADNASYTWESTDTSVAAVDANGAVTGVAPGTCRVYARNSEGFEDYIPIKVVEDYEERLALHLNVTTDPTKRLWLGDDPQAVTWSIDHPNIATIDSNGRVTAVSQGLTVARGELNGVEHYIYVRVNA
ncbi:Ig-like domain-containing protein [Oscillospiraceae bacterium OttesenSCG-928-G22]|nr:Ig-like domain-containing protein [Oscillospiraceae bacterium OttesenSCG-928-G22]